ncbi:AAA family ATPase [Allosphingosinicella sp.]|uniref:AAA family ATPase n=1 Tax=Allosphingosinicella sp. TaxID=2823234 RepID=UPI002EDED492
MTTFHMVCGLPASGKSTLARQLAAQPDTIWLSPDEWMRRIVGDGYDNVRRDAVEQVQWELARKLLQLGLSVVLDNGFWSHAERAVFREEAARVGAQTRLHFCDAPLAELQRRAVARNRALPQNAFHVEPDDLTRWSRLFERPTVDELG